MSKSTSRKKYGFSYDSNKKNFDEVVDLGYGNSFHSLKSEHLLQMTVFEKIVEFYIFYRDPNKCFSPLRISLHDWRKIETIRERRYKKEKLKVQQDNLALFRRNHGVAHEEESDMELVNELNFCLSTHFFKFPI